VPAGYDKSLSIPPGRPGHLLEDLINPEATEKLSGQGREVLDGHGGYGRGAGSQSTPFAKRQSQDNMITRKRLVDLEQPIQRLIAKARAGNTKTEGKLPPGSAASTSGAIKPG
jgi:hypothetical protein